MIVLAAVVALGVVAALLAVRAQIRCILIGGGALVQAVKSVVDGGQWYTVMKVAGLAIGQWWVLVMAAGAANGGWW